jgi:FkbM family methyltransferase
VLRRARHRFEARLRARGWSPFGLSHEQVVWCYRVLLEREPENDAVIRERLEIYTSMRELRRDVLRSPEFRAANPETSFGDIDAVVIAEIEGEGRLFVDLRDDAVGLHIVRGNYEVQETEFFRSIIEPGMTVADVGANIGYYTLLAANRVGPSGAVVAFEPLEHNASLLVRMVEENELGDRVRVQRQAVSDRAGTAELTIAAGARNSGGAYLAPTTDVRPGFVTQQAETVTLDSFEELQNVDVLKIDVEGAEPFAFLGAQTMFEKARPIVICELHERQLQLVAGISARDLIARLDVFDYECRSIEDGGLGSRVRHPSTDLPETVAFVPR